MICVVTSSDGALSERPGGASWPPVSETAGPSVLPEALEPLWRHLRIADRVLNIPMPEVVLDGSRVVALVRQLEAARVPQHVRMDRESELRRVACSPHDLAERRVRERSTAFRREDIRRR